MSTQTPTLGLTLTPSSEGAKFFKDWVDENSGVSESSNFNKIDTAIGEIQNKNQEQDKALDLHASDLTKHVSTSEKKAWNEKASSSLENVTTETFQEKAVKSGIPTTKSMGGETNGKLWVLSPSQPELYSASWHQPVYANGIWVTCGGKETISDKAAYSLDGKTWVDTTLPANITWHQPVYANGVWVVFSSGYDGQISYSLDGKTWISSNITKNTYWNQPVYADGVWVTCANKDSSSTYGNRISYSNDGKSWTTLNPTGMRNLAWNQPVYANGVWVVCCSKGNQVLYGASVRELNTTTLPADTTWHPPVYANGVWVTCGGNSGVSDQAAYSLDGKTWTGTTLPASTRWHPPVYANGVWVTCGGTSDQAAYSLDGKTWVGTTLPASTQWHQPVYANGVWVVCGRIGGNAAFSEALSLANVDLSNVSDQAFQNKLNSVRPNWAQSPMQFVIPASAWSVNSTYSDYAYRTSLSISGLTVADLVNIYFDGSSYTVANESGIAGFTETASGVVYIYATEKPTSSLTGKYIVIKGAPA